VIVRGTLGTDQAREGAGVRGIPRIMLNFQAFRPHMSEDPGLNRIRRRRMRYAERNYGWR
jgi:hypothetical protein